MSDAIRVEGLTKTYNNFKLDDVSFSVPCGSIMGFIGENGAGKSTTIKAILKLIALESGKVTLLGKDLEDAKAAMEDIGVVFDESNFHDNLVIGGISKIMGNIYRNWDNALFSHYMKQFKLPQKKKVKEFSRGMKMKLCIAVALSHHPKLLILDEATSGLDPIVREEILDIFLEFIQDEEHTILISSHITSDLDKIADYITFIHEGKIVFSKSKLELTDEMGLLRCNAADFSKLAHAEVIRFRQDQFGYEVLINHKSQFRTRHPSLEIAPVTTEQIMLFYIRGQRF